MSCVFFSLLIELACDPTRTADVAALIMHEGKCQVGSRLYREEDDVSYYSVMFVCVYRFGPCVCGDSLYDDNQSSH